MRKAREATVAAAMTGITAVAARKGSTAERAAAVVNITGGGVAAAAAGSERDVHVLAQSTGTLKPLILFILSSVCTQSNACYRLYRTESLLTN
jgi:hypothetical protein